MSRQDADKQNFAHEQHTLLEDFSAAAESIDIERSFEKETQTGRNLRPRLYFSTFLNVLLCAIIFRYHLSAASLCSSPYANLEFDTVQTIDNFGPYSSQNRNETHRAQLWETLDGDLAQVAIDKVWAEKNGLLASQRFSWDDSKDVYSIRGLHGQHCLRKLYRWVTISHHNGTQLDQYNHILHCLDSLLQDVHCHADDTPMMSTPGIWGQGQQRLCRDWKKLEEWARSHNACFKYINETQGVASMFDRYKWCPPGSPYMARMRSFMNLTQDNELIQPEDIDSLPAYWKNFK